MKIAALVPSFEPNPHQPKLVGQREGYEVDRFAAAVGEAAGIRVPVIEGSLAAAPADGYVLLFDAFGLDDHPTLALRAILINADRADVRKQLERYQLLGAIESLRYFLWQSARRGEIGHGHGLFGRKDLAPAIGACLSEPFTAHYGLFVVDSVGDLPSLVAIYLTEVERNQTRGSIS